MTLLDTIKNDLMEARFAKNQQLVTVLSTLFSEAASVGKTRNSVSNDSEVISVVKKFKEGVEVMLHHKGHQYHDDLIQEISIYDKYLPQTLTTDELNDIIKDKINNFNLRNIGAIMSELKKEYFGRFDGKEASTLIKVMLDS